MPDLTITFFYCICVNHLLVHQLVVSAQHNGSSQQETQVNALSKESTKVKGENCNHISGPKKKKQNKPKGYWNIIQNP